MANKRRPNGDGNIRRRDNGTYEISIMNGYDPDTGKRRVFHFYGSTLREARARAKSFMDDLNDGIQANANITFDGWGTQWLTTYQENISPSTYDSYKHTLRLLNNFFEGKKLQVIRTIDVENMLMALRREGRSRSYISKCRGMMFQIMKKSVAAGLTRVNVVASAEKMHYREPEKRREAFTTEEVSILMRELPHTTVGLATRALLLGCGLRVQEAVALTKEDVEPDGSILHIRKAINRLPGGGEYIGPTKSATSTRDVPVPTNLRWCVLELRKNCDKYLFESKRKPGRPMSTSHFREEYYKALDKVENVRRLSPHSCRHSYVSMLASLHVDLPVLQSLVGHADLDMVRHYLHVEDHIRKEAVERISDLFPSDSSDHTE